MRLASFTKDDLQGVGCVVGDWLINAGVAYKKFYGGGVENLSSMLMLLQAGERLLEGLKRVVFRVQELIKDVKSLAELRVEGVVFGLDEVKLCAPIPRPPKIICLGLNYEDHAKEGGFPIPKEPVLFAKPHTSVIGTGDAIVIPKATKKVDYEVELAVVIGKACRRISARQAYDYVAGYTIFNDVSARDLGPPMMLAMKGVDTFAPMGPYLVLKDQVPDPHNLEITLRVNGEVRQHSNTGQMIFKIPQIIEYISSIITLEVGDVIATGTPAGVGIVREQRGEVGKLLKPGDVVECEIEGLGILRNPVRAEE